MPADLPLDPAPVPWGVTHHAAERYRERSARRVKISRAVLNIKAAQADAVRIGTVMHGRRADRYRSLSLDVDLVVIDHVVVTVLTKDMV